MTQTTAAKNRLTQGFHNTDSKLEQPSTQQINISYGYVTEVDVARSLVSVRMYQGEGKADKDVLKGALLPVIQPLSVINHLYGALHKGMQVRILWNGKNEPKSALIEIIGNEDFDLQNVLAQKPEHNRVDTQPYQLFTGGVMET